MRGRFMCAVYVSSRKIPVVRLVRRLLPFSYMLAGSPAHAAEGSLLWDAPAGCGDAEQVLAVVKELTGGAPPELPPDRRIRAVVHGNDRRWEAVAHAVRWNAPALAVDRGLELLGAGAGSRRRDRARPRC